MTSAGEPAVAKVCKRCGKTLPFDEFYSHPGMADGHLSFCKTCTKQRVKTHYLANLEQLRAYHRAISTRYRGQRNQYGASYKKRYPERVNAHTALARAVRSGRVIRPDCCSVCGTKCQPIGHHDDYSRPLDVKWLCQACHVRLHHELRQQEVAA